MTPQEMLDAAILLNDLQEKENNGRGITCVRSIITYLQREDEESANAVYQNEGDKIRSYPKVEAAIYNLFGCRLHSKKDCHDWICESLKKSSSGF